ncbi:MAG: glutamyl-tRNA reductase [Paenibacillaceae bacterium]
MHIIAVSLNHHTAPVEVRERFTFSDERLPEALIRLKQTKSILEGVIVSTCNRTEIYAVVDRLHMCGHYIRGFLENWFGISRDQFIPYLSIHEDQEAIKHLFRVTCGLDSMMIGETQILGQVRSSFLTAQKEAATGTFFNMLFKQAITLAKKVHTETGIGESAVSVSYAAVELGKRIFGDYHHKSVMIIGAGKMGELTVKHLHANGASKVIVANRTLARAEELAARWNGIACSMDNVKSILTEHGVDIVISSTGAEGYVLSREQMDEVMRARFNKPLFLIDIAVPRDFDPEIAKSDQVFLYDMDDLQAIVESNVNLRRREGEKVEDLIKQEITVFQQWYKLLGVSPVIRALQEKAALIHKETMDSLIKKLPDLEERELKIIHKLSKSIVNQMLHDPILRVKELAAERHGDDAIKMFSHLFALEEWVEEHDALPEDALLESEVNKEEREELDPVRRISLPKLQSQPMHS